MWLGGLRGALWISKKGTDYFEGDRAVLSPRMQTRTELPFGDPQLTVPDGKNIEAVKKKKKRKKVQVVAVELLPHLRRVRRRAPAGKHALVTFGQPITGGEVEKQTLRHGTARRHSKDQCRTASGTQRELRMGSDRLLLQRRIYRSSAPRRGWNRSAWVGGCY